MGSVVSLFFFRHVRKWTWTPLILKCLAQRGQAAVVGMLFGGLLMVVAVVGGVVLLCGFGWLGLVSECSDRFWDEAVFVTL